MLNRKSSFDQPAQWSKNFTKVKNVSLIQVWSDESCLIISKTLRITKKLCEYKMYVEFLPTTFVKTIEPSTSITRLLSLKVLE